MIIQNIAFRAPEHKTIKYLHLSSNMSNLMQKNPMAGGNKHH